MPQPRFRLFAGPNGSGKTFFFNHLKRSGYINTEIYVSADKIEAVLRERHAFNFNAYRVKVSER
jgi:predicted ABC-type ATPase